MASIANRRVISVLAAVVVSGLLVGFLASQTEWSTLVASVSELSVREFAVYLILYVALGLARSLRYDALLRPRVGPLRLLPVTWVHNLLAQTLPLRSGEFSYPLLVKRFLRQSGSMALGGLIVVRLIELMLVMLFGIVAALVVVEDKGGDAAKFSLLAAVGLGATFLLLRYSPTLVRAATRLLGFVLAILSMERIALSARLLNSLDIVTDQLDWAIRERRFLLVAALSVVIHMLNVGAVAFLLNSIYPGSLPLLAMVAAISFVMAAAWIPLTIAGFGVVEGGWVIALTFFGDIQVTEAVALGFTMHSVQILAAMSCGAAGGLFLMKPRLKPKAR